MVNVSAVYVDDGTGRNYRAFRLWSDGSVDVTRMTFVAIGSCIIQNECGPVEVVAPDAF